MPKSYNELSFIDDFMFCKILSTNPDLTKELLEIILDIKILEIRFPEPQKTIEITADGRGIRLDVYVESGSDNSADGNHKTVYDIEMQTRLKNDLAKRSRYYQGMIDLNLIERNAEFVELKKSYVIFICLDDPFKEGRHIYTFENRCIQDTNIALNDETFKVFLNPKGHVGDVSPELGDFLKYLASGTVNSDFTKRLDTQVESAKMKEQWRLEYMTLYMRDRDIFEDGKAEGLLRGKSEAVISMYKKSRITVEEAADELNISVEEFNELLAQEEA